MRRGLHSHGELTSVFGASSRLHRLTDAIAGAAERGARGRVYVDNVFLAEDEAGFGDRFLVTGDTGMSVGEHLVRADQISPDGRVVARAEVPFTRPEGATAAAVASPLPAPHAAPRPRPPHRQS